MMRQCAWCLCLIDEVGERISALPFPKLYDASHGMCGECGVLWMEQVLESLEIQPTASWKEEIVKDVYPQERNSETSPSLQAVTALLLHLQQKHEGSELVEPTLDDSVSLV